MKQKELTDLQLDQLNQLIKIGSDYFGITKGLILSSSRKREAVYTKIISYILFTSENPGIEEGIVMDVLGRDRCSAFHYNNQHPRLIREKLYNDAFIYFSYNFNLYLDKIQGQVERTIIASFPEYKKIKKDKEKKDREIHEKNEVKSIITYTKSMEFIKNYLVIDINASIENIISSTNRYYVKALLIVSCARLYGTEVYFKDIPDQYISEIFKLYESGKFGIEINENGSFKVN